jgi:ketol-acid reductoisomerase
MTEVLDEIRSGDFADEWSSKQKDASTILENIRQVRNQMPLAKWDQLTRTAFRIGDAA